jgi:hypothetical protein
LEVENTDLQVQVEDFRLKCDLTDQENIVLKDQIEKYKTRIKLLKEAKTNADQLADKAAMLSKKWNRVVELVNGA